MYLQKLLLCSDHFDTNKLPRNFFLIIYKIGEYNIRILLFLLNSNIHFPSFDQIFDHVTWVFTNTLSVIQVNTGNKMLMLNQQEEVKISIKYLLTL
jgi:hypothetical protein